jgi:hypothetical protein
MATPTQHEGHARIPDAVGESCPGWRLLIPGFTRQGAGMTYANAIREPVPPLTSVVASSGSEAFWFPTTLFICIRAMLLASSYVGLKLVPALYQHEDARQEILRAHLALDGLCRWDCGWYQRVATEGYLNPQSPNVFPLFPLLGRLVHAVTDIPLVFVLLAIANIASLLSYYVIYGVFCRKGGPRVARSGLLLFASYPFAYYQAAGYPESLMILGSALALLLAMEKKHLLAGHVLGLAILARQLSAFAGLGMLVAQLRQRPSPRRFLFNRDVLGLVIPFFYLGAFAYYMRKVTGDALAFVHAREIGWGPYVWYGVRQIWQLESYDEQPAHFIYTIVAVIPALGAVLLCTRRKWAELAASGVVLMVTIGCIGGLGLGRYSASCWPAFLPLGAWLSERPNWQGPVIGALFLFQGIFFFLFSHQFPIV